MNSRFNFFNQSRCKQSPVPIIYRWYHYKQDSIKNHQSQEIHGLIREFINSGVNVNDAFEWEILEICWSDSKTIKREDDWID